MLLPVLILLKAQKNLVTLLARALLFLLFDLSVKTTPSSDSDADLFESESFFWLSAPPALLSSTIFEKVSDYYQWLCKLSQLWYSCEHLLKWAVMIIFYLHCDLVDHFSVCRKISLECLPKLVANNATCKLVHT